MRRAFEVNLNLFNGFSIYIYTVLQPEHRKNTTVLHAKKRAGHLPGIFYLSDYLIPPRQHTYLRQLRAEQRRGPIHGRLPRRQLLLLRTHHQTPFADVVKDTGDQAQSHRKKSPAPQLAGVFARQDKTELLRRNRPAIHRIVEPIHGTTGNAVAVTHCPTNSVAAAVQWQK